METPIIYREVFHHERPINHRTFVPNVFVALSQTIDLEPQFFEYINVFTQEINASIQQLDPNHPSKETDFPGRMFNEFYIGFSLQKQLFTADEALERLEQEGVGSYMYDGLFFYFNSPNHGVVRIFKVLEQMCYFEKVTDFLYGGQFEQPEIEQLEFEQPEFEQPEIEEPIQQENILQTPVMNQRLQQPFPLLRAPRFIFNVNELNFFEPHPIDQQPVNRRLDFGEDLEENNIQNQNMI